jgi:ligand-binding sensor domain-containing protein/signal transduction histidine kinase/ActR/RegA family two-component response regulator
MSFCRLIPGFLAVLLTGLASAPPAQAADDSVRFLHQIWQSEDGLPSQAVSAILQSRDGFLWTATPGGLARFDGTRFTISSIQSSDPDRPHSLLCQTADGSLWTSTDEGMARILGGQTTIYTTNHGLPSQVITTVYQDREQRIWAGTPNGVLQFDGANFLRMPTNAAFPNNNIRVMIEDRAGTLWIGTQRGLYSCKNGKATLEAGIPRGMVQSLCEARSGAFWVGMTLGLGRLQEGHWTVFADNPGELDARNVRALYEDPTGTLWIGTSAGVQRFIDGKFYSVITSGLTASDFDNAVPGTVNAICGDDQGDIWVATALGLNRLKKQPFRLYNQSDGVPEKQVTSVLQSRSGDLWMGTVGGGLARLHDGHFSAWNTNQGLPQTVRGLCEDKSGALWVGGDNLGGGEGLYCFKDGQVIAHFTSANSLGLVDDVMRVIFEDHEGTLWLGGQYGLTRYKQGKFERITAGLRDYVKAIAEDRQGRIWVGSKDGLTRLGGGQTVSYRDSLKMREVVNAIYEAKDGMLWFGTDRGRLFHLRDDRLVLSPTRGAFTSIMGIVGDDDGNLWLSSNTGVFRLAKGELAAQAASGPGAPAPMNVSKLEGIHRAQCNGIAQPSGWKDQAGSIWFPTLVGAIAVNVKDFQTASFQPPVVIEQVAAGGQPIDPGSQTRLPRHSSQLAFDYTALNLRSPEKVLFQCRLDGLDKDWQNVGTQRSIRYAGLAPGHYVFRVRASNTDGVWENDGAPFAFVLLPRFYQTSWFFAICVAAVSLAGYGVFRWTVRLRRLIQKQRDQELFKLVDEWTKSLQHEVIERKQAQKALVESQEIVMRQERLAAVGQMAAGVAHEFNNILTVIQGHAALLLDNPSLDPDSIKSLTHITSGVERTAKLIKQMLAFSRKQIMQREVKDLNAVASNVADMLGPMLGESIAIRRLLADKPLTVLADAAMIEQAIVNLAVNARDAMPKGGELTIATREILVTEAEAKARVERRAGQFARLSVTDTGCGMDSSVIDHLFEPFFTTKEVGKGVGLGLATVYGMVKQHQGWVEVESQPGKGASFHITLPFTGKAVEKPADKPPPAKVDGGKETILVVEDEEDLRDLVRDVLEGHGYQVLQAGSGVEALRVWETHGRKVDLLLSDMIMPEGMSGRELAEKLQRADPHLPAILTSGYSQDMIEREAVLDARVKFFSKPYHPAQMAQAVRDSLNTRKENGGGAS